MVGLLAFISWAIVSLTIWSALHKIVSAFWIKPHWYRPVWWSLFALGWLVAAIAL